MNILVSRLERSTSWLEADPSPLPWLPPESPLAMPRQSLDEADPQVGLPPASSPAGIARRRWAVFGAAAVLTVLVAVGPYMLV
ncbi:MAG TPA: hypothetical protein VGN89_13625, partial [Phenylobacterium sp.]|nr:hypothetical protein [Phenylobacterium sp.]